MTTSPVSPSLRTNVYVDGFNFYYRAVKDTPYKWHQGGASRRQTPAREEPPSPQG